jgi:hypothetical protein
MKAIVWPFPRTWWGAIIGVVVVGLLGGQTRVDSA